MVFAIKPQDCKIRVKTIFTHLHRPPKCFCSRNIPLLRRIWPSNFRFRHCRFSAIPVPSTSSWPLLWTSISHLRHVANRKTQFEYETCKRRRCPRTLRTSYLHWIVNNNQYSSRDRLPRRIHCRRIVENDLQILHTHIRGKRPMAWCSYGAETKKTSSATTTIGLESNVNKTYR